MPDTLPPAFNSLELAWVAGVGYTRYAMATEPTHDSSRPSTWSPKSTASSRREYGRSPFARPLPRYQSMRSSQGPWMWDTSDVGHSSRQNGLAS